MRVFFLDPWLHNNVHFDSKSGYPPVSFLCQATYCFEAYEVRNRTPQTICDLELKWESCSWLNQGCSESMAAQWLWLQLKIGATSWKIFGIDHHGFEAKEVRNTLLQTDHNSELKRRRYGWLKQDCVGMQLRDWVRAKLFLVVWAYFWASFVVVGPIGFFFFFLFH